MGVGLFVGLAVGLGDGGFVGLLVGLLVGLRVGNFVGLRVGLLVGLGRGPGAAPFVGLGVGSNVGRGLGWGVGDGVGGVGAGASLVGLALVVLPAETVLSFDCAEFDPLLVAASGVGAGVPTVVATGSANFDDVPRPLAVGCPVATVALVPSSTVWGDIETTNSLPGVGD